MLRKRDGQRTTRRWLHDRQAIRRLPPLWLFDTQTPFRNAGHSRDVRSQLHPRVGTTSRNRRKSCPISQEDEKRLNEVPAPSSLTPRKNSDTKKHLPPVGAFLLLIGHFYDKFGKYL
jgi:hypothetical protein